MKHCKKCNQTKSLDSFAKCSRLSDGKQSYCKSCLSLLNAEYRSKNKDKDKKRNAEYHKKEAEKVRDRHYKNRYGISYSVFMDMYKDQEGCCKICNTSLTLGDRSKTCAVLDHCHTTGKVRGVLCTMCNTALGKFCDSITILQSAIDYLEETR